MTMHPNNHDDWQAGVHIDDQSEEPDPAVDAAREVVRNRSAPWHSDDPPPSSVMPGVERPEDYDDHDARCDLLRDG